MPAGEQLQFSAALPGGGRLLGCCASAGPGGVGHVLVFRDLAGFTERARLRSQMVRSGEMFLAVFDSMTSGVLVADATICTPAGVPYAQRYTYPGISYTQVKGGFYIPHLSPHLKAGRFPSGGNVGFKDGHVVWRKFDEMDQRCNGGESFWW